MRRNALFTFIFSLILISFSPFLLAAQKGLFWKMESPAGVTSYLFGTMHTDDNRVSDLSPTVIEAVKSVDTFIMEAESGNDPKALMMEKGSLAEMITEAEFEQVRELADFHVMHLGAAMQMKPWLLAVIFDLPKPQTPFAQDNLLMRKAEDLGKEVIGIETSKEHFAVMDSFSLEEQLVMLRAVLKRPAAEKEANFEKLITAYMAGDAENVAALDDQMTGSILPKAMWAKMRTKLIDERNVVMAARTVEKAKQTPVFIAVGASHLAGEGGLVSAFNKAGFKLSPVNVK